MINSNSKKLLTIHLIRNIIVCFFNIFLSIYILQVLNKNLITYSCIMIYSLLFHFAFQYFILKNLTTKNFATLYKLGTFLLVISIGMLLYLKEGIINYIWLFYLIYAVADMLYWIPYETAIIDVGKNGAIDNFISFAAITSQIASLIVPVFSGYIITNFSYNIIFLIFLILALIIFFISCSIQEISAGTSKINMKKMMKVVKENPALKHIYIANFFKNLSQSGAITQLIPIAIFLKLKTEFKLGSATTFFAIITIISINIYKQKSKEINPKTYIIFGTIFIFITLLLVIFPSFETFLVYNLVYSSLLKIIELATSATTYNIVNVVGQSDLKKEHLMIFYYLINSAQIISWIFVLLIIKLTNFNSENIIILNIAILSFLFIPAVIYLYKSKKEILNYNERKIL